jgi:hypothetical protein
MEHSVSQEKEHNTTMSLPLLTASVVMLPVWPV